LFFMSVIALHPSLLLLFVLSFWFIVFMAFVQLVQGCLLLLLLLGLVFQSICCFLCVGCIVVDD
jgi:hypothetical protein